MFNKWRSIKRKSDNFRNAFTYFSGICPLFNCIYVTTYKCAMHVYIPNMHTYTCVCSVIVLNYHEFIAFVYYLITIAYKVEILFIVILIAIDSDHSVTRLWLSSCSYFNALLDNQIETFSGLIMFWIVYKRIYVIYLFSRLKLYSHVYYRMSFYNSISIL